MRVLLIGDGIRFDTGFAKVLRHIAVALVARGDEVHQIASLDTAPDCDSRYYHQRGVIPHFPAADTVGASILQDTLRAVRPDVVLLNSDPGTAYAWLAQLHGERTVLYAPVEGAPIHPLLGHAFKRATRACTYTQWAHDKLLDGHKVDIPWVYHGVEADLFQPLCPQARADARRDLGWEGLFVTAYVARNNGRKGHDRLLKAATQLPAHHRVYLHCTPSTDQLGGWDLGFLAEYWRVDRRIDFSPQTDERLGLPVADLARRLAAADCYVSPSQVEGFGLPTLEAMAAGLPVIVPDDHGNQAEVVADAAYSLLPVRDWDTYHTCAQLSAVHPFHLAQAILHVAEHPAEAAAAGQRSRQRASLPCFTWDTMTETILGLIEEAAAA